MRQVIISTSGFIRPTANLERALLTLARLKEKHSFIYKLLGQSDDWQAIRQLITRYGLSERTEIIEDANQTLEQTLARADIALYLPEQAESATLQDLRAMMSAGAALILMDAVRFPELPEDAVVKIDADADADALLRAYLERLIEDSNLRERIALNALRFAQNGNEESAHQDSPTAPQISIPSGRRLSKIPGLDYKRGALLYPEKLDASHRHHLSTKPFYNLARKLEKYAGEGLDEDTRRHFADFANIAYALSLPTSARLLDVGCGSGWLTEYFARFGYDVTGIDISPALIEMARERLRRVPFGVDQETPLRYHFLTHDVERAPLSETFDAIICYDALHHFEDERAVFKHLSLMLNYGGLLFIHEGDSPAADSAEAEELRAVMRQYETLESPFARDYLRELLASHGFAILGDYVSVSSLFERERLEAGNLLRVKVAGNYLLCKKVRELNDAAAQSMPDTLAPGTLRARITLQGAWTERIAAGELIEATIEVENTGDTLWLESREALRGRVRLGCKIIDEAGRVVDEFHGAPPITRAFAPGEKVLLKVERRAPAAQGSYALKIDLVNQDICWFEERGSEPLVLPFIVQV